MKDFDLLLPATVDQAVRALPTEGDLAARRRVRPLAGGQDLLGELADHLEEPELVVDLKGVEGLGGLRERPDGGLELGALVTLAELVESELVRARAPMLADAAESVGSPQIRSAGTVGGNLCQRPRCWYYRNEHTVCLKKGGDECFAYGGRNRHNAILGGGPSYIVHPSDLAPALVALDAEVVLAGPDGERTLPLEEFYVLPAEADVTKETVLAPNELVARVVVPPREGWRAVWLKARDREAFDFALAAVALALRTEGGRIAEARVVLGGVAPKPWRAPAAEAALTGASPGDPEAGRAAARAALRGAEPLEENGYKVPLTEALVARALRSLA